MIDEAPYSGDNRRLEYPEPAALRTAFQELPRRAALEVVCRAEGLTDTLGALEEAGAFALEIHADAESPAWRVTALKGKSGACFETGRSATYLGGAAAACDDDGHLLFGDMRVCEKTGGLYTLPPYRGLIRVSAADPALLAKLDTAPVPFDCNTFERDAAALAARVADQPDSGQAVEARLYAGPFRMLVLRDGALVRRGEPVRLTEAQRQSLGPNERLLPAPSDTVAQAHAPARFAERHARDGALCLVTALARQASPGSAAVSPPGARPLDLAALDRAPESVRRRLAVLIERADPYFMMSGSDPREANGCCPSVDVGETNRLVEAGILSRLIPAAHPDACTTALYALAGEIRLEPGSASPTFTANAALRAAVAERLRQRRLFTRSPIKATLRAAIVLLFVLGVAAAIRQALPARDDRSLDALMAAAVPPPRSGSGVEVVVYLGTERCARCAALERLGRQVVRETFASEAAAGRVTFAAVDLAKPENAALRQRQAQPFSTLGLVRFEPGQPPAVRMITEEAWNLYQDEPAFRDMLAEKVRSFLAGKGSGS